MSKKTKLEIFFQKLSKVLAINSRMQVKEEGYTSSTVKLDASTFHIV